MDQHDQSSYTNEVGAPGEREEDQRGDMVNNLLLEVLKEKEEKVCFLLPQTQQLHSFQVQKEVLSFNSFLILMAL